MRHRRAVTSQRWQLKETLPARNLFKLDMRAIALSERSGDGMGAPLLSLSVPADSRPNQPLNLSSFRNFTSQRHYLCFISSKRSSLVTRSFHISQILTLVTPRIGVYGTILRCSYLHQVSLFSHSRLALTSTVM